MLAHPPEDAPNSARPATPELAASTLQSTQRSDMRLVVRPIPGYPAPVRYVLAIVVPPLGLLAAGRGGQALVCLILWLTIIGWPLAALWALLVVNSAETESRVRRAMKEERDRR